MTFVLLERSSEIFNTVYLTCGLEIYLFFCMMIRDCYLGHPTVMYKLQGSLLSTQLILLYRRDMQLDVSSTCIVVFRPCKYIKTKIAIATSVM